MKSKYLLLIAGILLVTSCNDFLKEEPENFLSAESNAVDKNLVEAEIQGAYKSMLWFKNGRQGFIGISGTDEAQGKTVEANYWAEQGAIDKYNTSLNADNWLVKWLWDSGYFGISRANTAITSSRKTTGESDEWKESKEAEARFVRAFDYFMLAQYFGNVPLITEETKVSTRPNYPRVGLSTIYKYIEQDLLFCESKLKTNYREGRPTVGAAKAMLMKVYMYAPDSTGMRDYKKAAQKFEEIEKLGVYSLQSSYADLFDPDYENGTESVYEFQFQYPDEPNYFQYFCGSRAIGEFGEGGGYGIFLPTKRYLNLFDAEDERFAASVRTEFYKNGALLTSASDPEYISPHCKKYEDFKRNNDAYNSSKNIYYIRYADLILLYAECLNDQGSLDLAKKQIQRVRDRAHASSAITATTKEEMLDYIYEERMRELGMEGWRRMDLIRRGASYFVSQVDKYNKFAKGNVKAYHCFYPIPTNEINMNEGISPEDQNEGYK
jgi:hypothetical protein